jgi:hypothetical protein
VEIDETNVNSQMINYKIIANNLLDKKNLPKNKATKLE